MAQSYDGNITKVIRYYYEIATFCINFYPTAKDTFAMLPIIRLDIKMRYPIIH